MTKLPDTEVTRTLLRLRRSQSARTRKAVGTGSASAANHAAFKRAFSQTPTRARMRGRR